MKIADLGYRESLRVLLPHFVVAGRLACRIQDDIVRNGNRNGDVKTGDRFTEALTDADILVESYLGTMLLSTFEDAAFFGEEYERDRISAYFPKDAPYLVTLDPVDGTLYFKDGLPVFSTIMTICSDGGIAAAVVYVPKEERFYFAVAGEGAWTTTAGDVLSGRDAAPFVIRERGDVVLLGKNLLDRKPALEAAGFSVTTPSLDYDGSKTWDRTSLRMFTGDVVGKVFARSQLIDAGAIGFVVANAGGKDNGPVFDPVTRLSGDLVCATSPATYDRIIGAIGR